MPPVRRTPVPRAVLLPILAGAIAAGCVGTKVIRAYPGDALPAGQAAALSLHGDACSARPFAIAVDTTWYGPGCKTRLELAPGRHIVRARGSDFGGFPCGPSSLRYRPMARGDSARFTFDAKAGGDYRLSVGTLGAGSTTIVMNNAQTYAISLEIREAGVATAVARGMILYTC